MNVRRTRLITGITLLTYLATHLLNHSLGLISLEAMEIGRLWFLAFWRNPLATAALYASFLVHFGLALWSLYQRHHLRMPLWEALQLTLGLCIPLLLAVHFAGTRLAHEWYGVQDSYSKIVLTLWKLSPIHGWRQSILIVIAWIHGCIGFHFWLRLRPWYSRYAQTFFALALILPVLALLGFAQAGREIDHLIDRDPGWIERTARASNTLGPGQGQDLVTVRDGIVYGFWLCLGGVWIARVMALFGVETTPELACRQALAAAHVMVREVDALSQKLAVELPVPLKIGIGIHSGPAIVGRMGFGSNVHLTAIGDTVNVASRLQDLTKEYGCQLVISEQAAMNAGIDPSILPRHELTVRNRLEPLAIFVVDEIESIVKELSAMEKR